MRGFLLFGIVLSQPLLNSGCDEDKKTIEPPIVDEYPDGPTEILTRLKEAYSQQNLDRYAELFAPDFQFRFSPNDVEENPDLPESWPLADELTSARKMFLDESVERVFVRFTPTTLVPAVEEDQAPPGSWKMFVEPVHLEVETRLENGDPLTLLVDADRAQFFFIETDEMTSDNRKKWKINLWRDQPISSSPLAATQETTWGQVKGVWR